MYHLPDTLNVTTLELKADGTFRWIVQGCDFFGGDVGRWSAEGGDLVLLPRTGRDYIRWPSDHGQQLPARVVLHGNAARDGFDAEIATSEGIDEQSWLPGGWCAQCGGGVGQLGPTDAYECDDPFGSTRIDI